MSNTINGGPYSQNLPYVTDSEATGDASGANNVAQTPGTAEAQAASNLQALLLPYVANALGVNAYGNVSAGSGNVGIGQVMMPPSTLVAANAAALQNIQALQSSYGQGGASGADGVVGTSLINAAENGELPNLSGPTGNNSVPSNGVGTTAASSSSPPVTVNSPLQNVDTSTASDQLLTEQPGNTTDAGDPLTVSNRTPESSSVATDSVTSSFASTLSTNSDNQGTSDCRHLKNGENDNVKLIKSLGIKDNKQAARIAQMLNTENQQRGTDGTPKQNIINMMAVLYKLQESGQGKSQAAEQARNQLNNLVGIVGDSGKGMLTTDFIGASNVAASFVTQFGLNPSLTQFVEPSISTASIKSTPWPQ